ncbi:MAG: hypothetical protein L6R38_001011 [Xanthoria sp. 2 TBL-2021]|nr:MAG: hypothetical protein L6R38_001011 [Xanthoria sp. 2 TBL-2021]
MISLSSREKGIRVYQGHLSDYREGNQASQTGLKELWALKKKYETILMQSANESRGVQFTVRRGIVELKESNEPGRATKVAGLEKRLNDCRASYEHDSRYIRTMLDTIPQKQAHLEQLLQRNRKGEQEVLSLINSTTQRLNRMKEQAHQSQKNRQSVQVPRPTNQQAYPTQTQKRSVQAPGPTNQQAYPTQTQKRNVQAPGPTNQQAHPTQTQKRSVQTPASINQQA